MTDQELAERAAQLNVRIADLTNLHVVDRLLTDIQAWTLRIVPIRYEQNSAQVIMDDPSDVDDISTLMHLKRLKHVDILIAKPEDLDVLLERHFATGEPTGRRLRQISKRVRAQCGEANHPDE